MIGQTYSVFVTGKLHTNAKEQEPIEVTAQPFHITVVSKTYSLTVSAKKTEPPIIKGFKENVVLVAGASSIMNFG